MEEVTAWSCFGGFLLITYMIYLPISLYYAIKFNKYNHSMFVAKRNPKIVLLFICSALLFILLDRPLHSLYYTCLYFDHIKCYQYSNITLKITYPLSTLGVASSTFIRIWQIYYDIKFNQSILNTRWKVLFNPSLNNKNWFIKHHKNIGNVRFMTKYLILPIITFIYIIIVIEWTYVAFFNLNYRIYANATDMIIFLLIVVFILIISCKTPKFHDTFNIRGETKQLLICVIIQMFGANLILFIATYFGMNWYYITIIQSHWFSIFAFIAILIQTLYVFKILGIDKANNGFIYNIPDTSITGTSLQIELTYHTVSRPKNKEKRNEKNICLEFVLKNEDYFEFFIEHLLNEFSSEVVISLIEFQFFQQFIMDINEFEDELKEIKNDFNNEYKIYELNKSIPESFIVCNGNNEHLINQKLLQQMRTKNNKSDEYIKQILIIKNIAHRLYLKYLKTGAEFEINISHIIRESFEEMMDNHNKWMLLDLSVIDLLDLFQEIKLEMLMLLDFSYQRFIKSQQFEIIQQKH